MGSHDISNFQALPLKSVPTNDLDYHTQHWTSGTRGGGKVPKDFGWRTNPKQAQEELGAGSLEPKK
jgi:hypothetical protein